MELSKNFSQEEFEYSETALMHGIPNKMTIGHLENAKTLIGLFLQNLRIHLKKPIIITSGYRGRELNKMVGGSETSAHCTGCAVDFHVPGMTITELYEFIYNMVVDGLMPAPDQVIFEKDRWVHLGIKPDISNNRNQWLKTTDGRTYTPYPIHKIK